MASQRKIMKFFVLVILVVFLLSSGLVSVMYFVDMSKNAPAETLSGDVLSGEVDTGDITIDVSSIGQGALKTSK